MYHKDVNFMQSSIKNQTGGEHTVLGNAEALKSGALKATDLPEIRIWQDADGKLWTLDHRRLATFRMTELDSVPFMWAKFTSSYLGSPTEISSGREHMANYSYDAMGRLSSALGGGMRYDYRYYEGGLLKEKRASERILTSYTYDAEGNVTSTYAYDELLNIKALKTEAGKQTLADNHYFYDGNGNQIRKEGLEGTNGYAYDGRNRLTEISYPSAIRRLHRKAGI